MASKSTDYTLEDFIKFSDRETPEKMKEIAARDLGETEELKEKALKEMKALVNEHGLACITTDDFLLRFLRTKKFQVQESFQRLQNYAKQRVDIHKDLMELQPEVFEKCLRLKIFGYLPYRDPQESIIYFHDTGAWNPKVCSDKAMWVMEAVMANFASEHEYAQISGGVLIFDSTCLPLPLLPYLLRYMYTGSNFLFNSLPMRFRTFHCINAGNIVKYILKILDPFLPKKIKSRVILHGKSRDQFFQCLPPCIIPDEYGGTLGPLSNNHIVDTLLNYLQKMKDEQKYFVEENI